MHVAADLDRARIRAKFAHIDELFEFREGQTHRVGAVVDRDHNAVEAHFAQRAIASDADLASDADVVRRRDIAADFVTELKAVELLALARAALVFFRTYVTVWSRATAANFVWLFLACAAGSLAGSIGIYYAPLVTTFKDFAKSYRYTSRYIF